MKITIRRINETEHDFFAYAKSICGKATYFVYFTDDIFGAVILHEFIEMLRNHFNPPRVDISIAGKDVVLKHREFLKILSK